MVAPRRLSDTTAFERIVDALHQAGSRIEHTSRGDVMAQCPSHSDGRPSLHVTDGDDRALVWCFAGCDAQDVLGAINLTKDDLFNSDATDYVYRDQTGSAYRTVTRRPGKRIFQSGQTKGTAVLYRLPEITAAVKAGTSIYLVEGEPDVHALVRRGYESTTAPAGAKNFDKADVTPLKGAHVIAVVDADEAGDSWAALVQDKVEPYAASLRFVQAAVGKDASDHLAAGKAVSEFVEYSPPDPLLDSIVTGDWLQAQVFPELTWVVPDLIPEGFGLVVGPPKVGKSYLTLGLALSVACGGRGLGKIPLGDPRPVLLLALEDSHRRLQTRAWELTQGEPIPSLLSVEIEPPEGAVFPLIQRWVERNRKRKPVVILDTLGKVMPPTRANESQYMRDYRIGSSIKHLAVDGVSVLVVHHTNKSESSDWMNSTSGTNGLNGAADFTLNLARKRNEPNGVLRVTGRDVNEGEYGLLFSGGSWYLDGDNLAQAEEAAASYGQSSRGTGDPDLGKKLIEALDRYDGGVGPGVLAQVVGSDSRVVAAELRRLLDMGVIRRIGHAEYASLSARQDEDVDLPLCFQHKVAITPGAGCPVCAGIE